MSVSVVFTFIAGKVRKQAKEYATGPDNLVDSDREAFYLDSMASEPVYNFCGLENLTSQKYKIGKSDSVLTLKAV